MTLTVAQMARLERLLDEVVELDSTQRRAWLDALPPSAEDLRPALERALLRAASDFLGTLPKFPASEDEAKDFAAGQRVGAYELIRRLGRGGMAQVWLARRADGAYEREVALKIPVNLDLRSDMATRFARERDILASLEHPNIARFYDAGIGQDGLPYLALEYVSGKSITDWCDARRFGVRERVELFLQVMDAMEAAHERGVLHRDIKPSNVLVTPGGQAMLLDFGVAKLLGDEQAQLTRVYGPAFTPAYASPEQIADQRLDASSDVYSLGVLLYELLAGKLPLAPQREAAAPDARSVTPPSRRVGAEAAEQRGAPLARVKRELRGDLDAIVMKALEREAQDRYPSVAAMARDLRRFLESRPVEARPGTLGYRAGRLLRRHPAGAVVAIAAVLAGGALAYALLARSPLAERGAAAARAPAAELAGADKASIAVLPFVDMSQKKDQEYFSDGLSEELIDRLSQAPGLRVIARTSSFQFKGRNEDIRAIAAKLGVSHLLEGSVRKDGNSLRITAQLIDAADGAHLWSHTYDRNLSGIFRLQEEIAATVADSLRVALHSAAQEPDSYSSSSEAYNLLLQGRYFLFHYNKADNEQAIALIGQALKIDPQYAMAWALLGNAYYGQIGFGVPVGEATARARAALERALSINPNLFSAYFTLAAIHAQVDWDWNAAQRDIDRMRDIRPDDKVFLPFQQANLLLVFGRLDEAARTYREILKSDPLYTWAMRSLAWTLLMSGQDEECLAVQRKLQEISPRFMGVHGHSALALLQMGQLQRAREELALEPSEDMRLEVSALLDWAQERRADSDANLRALTEHYGRSDPFSVGEAYAYRGEADEAFKWLDRALQQHQPDMTFLRTNPLLHKLRPDARFGALLESLHLTGAGPQPRAAPAAAAS